MSTIQTSFAIEANTQTQAPETTEAAFAYMHKVLADPGFYARRLQCSESPADRAQKTIGEIFGFILESRLDGTGKINPKCGIDEFHLAIRAGRLYRDDPSSASLVPAILAVGFLLWELERNKDTRTRTDNISKAVGEIETIIRDGFIESAAEQSRR